MRTLTLISSILTIISLIFLWTNNTVNFGLVSLGGICTIVALNIEVMIEK